ncbi:conserved hypothetical protein [Phenylobacterium zucineum HLK1]|uniref:DUF2306 domain-containing protein n=1 Tax=Phenylobacterium zucineum (strain HLK1) TaxID=450851 RepID=B4RGZ2_PHEZH|nr:DUF2306 domain-containing protein [Phenylobacterium zucineum]ACG77358.1 conserved hypothetical protein [Phenylobacterium zucineum HLK1]
MKASVSKGVWAFGALLSVLVALVSYRYVAGVGLMAPNVMANRFVQPWLVLHAGGASTALLIGAFQFMPRVRASGPWLHRWLGRTYAAGCLIGGVSGLALAAGTSAGPVAAWGFGLLAVAWIFTTLQAWRFARTRRFEAHRAWMVRSFALTFAAVTLRVYIPLSPLAGVHPEEAYVAIAWLCWVPNLAIAELWLRSRPALVAARA